MAAPQNFHIGQCWISEAEPELGVGFVREQDQHSVAVSFPAASQTRRYGKRTAPLKRLEFRIGDTVQASGGTQLVVEKVEVRDHLNWYLGSKKEICESDVSPKLKLQRPLQRLLAGKWDPLATFELRRQTLELWYGLLRSPWRGLIGPRAQLLPHQLYVATQIARRGLPRALLADEVGLGKTIEAGWILHQLMVTGRARRVLVVVPPALVNQWFIELLRRFNLTFWVPESQSEDGMAPEDFSIHDRIVVSVDTLKQGRLSQALIDAGWDMVIVDEAHRIGDAYDTLEKLAEKTHGLLLLTATPEQLGLEGHFKRLRLIDPVRFHSWDEYVLEYERYREVVKKAETLLSDRKAILELVDQYGTGRIYFRNSRKVVELEHCFFPKRKLVKHALAKDLRLEAWLGSFAKEHRTEKTLLICSSVARVVELERVLREEHGVKVVAFHEDQPLLVRDRNAAYFEDAQGATILLSSEIGGEGRNFQHASHLILADLPLDPDVLEQRIGRLDRIGQKSDISIHVPYQPKSREESLLRWHAEVFGAFAGPAKGAGNIYEQHRAALEEILEAKDNQALSALIERAAKDYAKTLQEIEAGRDRLIEINSFDAVTGTDLALNLEKAEKPQSVQEYLERLFDIFGLNVEELDRESYFVEPGDSMFSSYFPALPAEGMRFSYSRKKALARDDLAFMSWDHPMIVETMEAITRQEAGNVAVATWAQKEVVLECFFAFETVSDSIWYADEFLPAEPIRVVLEASGKDYTKIHTQAALRGKLSHLPSSKAQLVMAIPPEALRNILEKARQKAELTAQTLRATALTQMKAAVDAEILRLTHLQEKNGLVGRRELEWWDERKKKLEETYRDARVRMDSFVLILPHLS